MNENIKTVSQIRAESPFPWTSQMVGGGMIMVLDAMGREVPMFRLLALMNKLTTVMATQSTTRADDTTA